MKIIYITDPEILSIPIIECHEPLVDIKQSTELQYGPIPENELAANCYTKMRKTVFEKLCQAQKDLPNNWRFILYEGYRSLAVQQMIFDHEYSFVVKRMPYATHAERFHEATRLASPVINLDGTANIPAHNTGGAIDIEIITTDGQLVEMGMAAKDWAVVDPELCLTNCQTISQVAQQNRKVLYGTLSAHGFINYPTEWWHFSYGDRYWAYHQQEPHAIYGSADQLASNSLSL